MRRLRAEAQMARILTGAQVAAGVLILAVLVFFGSQTATWETFSLAGATRTWTSLSLAGVNRRRSLPVSPWFCWPPPACRGSSPTTTLEPWRYAAAGGPNQVVSASVSPN